MASSSLQVSLILKNGHKSAVNKIYVKYKNHPALPEFGWKAHVRFCAMGVLFLFDDVHGSTSISVGGMTGSSLDIKVAKPPGAFTSRIPLICDRIVYTFVHIYVLPR